MTPEQHSIRRARDFAAGKSNRSIVRSDVGVVLAALDQANARAEALQARVGRLEEALRRQGDNMAFALNNVEFYGWHEKFQHELAEDRQALEQ